MAWAGKGSFLSKGGRGLRPGPSLDILPSPCSNSNPAMSAHAGGGAGVGVRRISAARRTSGESQTPMRLSTLLKEIVPTGGLPDVDITGVIADSRRVIAGSLFVALKGGTTDGHRYFVDAAARGAAVLAGEQGDPGLGLPHLQVIYTRLFLAGAATPCNTFPARRMIMIGVTGTDGKTTTSSLLHHILESAGLATGLVTSVSAR